jgi:hypothetical protein
VTLNDAGEVLTGMSPECRQGNYAVHPGFTDANGALMFCVHRCHKVSETDFAKAYANKYALPLCPSFRTSLPTTGIAADVW